MGFFDFRQIKQLNLLNINNISPSIGTLTAGIVYKDQMAILAGSQFALYSRLTNGILQNAAVGFNSFCLTSNNQGVLVAGSSASGVHVSLDDGLTWLPRPGSGTNIASVASNANVIVAISNTGIYQSQDLGLTWTQIFIGFSHGNVSGKNGAVKFYPDIGRFIAVSGSGATTAQVAVSFDGAAWSFNSVINTATLGTSQWFNGQLYLFSNSASGTIYRADINNVGSFFLVESAGDTINTNANGFTYQNSAIFDGTIYLATSTAQGMVLRLQDGKFVLMPAAVGTNGRFLLNYNGNLFLDNNGSGFLTTLRQF